MRKRKGEKKIIVLILEEIISDFSRELIQNLVNAIPESSDIRLVVLAGKYVDPNETSKELFTYKTVYNTVFRLSEICHIDGLIIHLGSMSEEKLNEMDTIYSESFRKIPKIFIGINTDRYPTVNYDNESGINEAMNFLINVNGLTKFCMLGGKDDNVDACKRKEIFINCLKNNNIQFSEKNYVKTDMSYDCIPEALELIDNNPCVQAIFCVNDATAKGMYEALKLRGMTPGKDILIFGFDNTIMSGKLSPTLSSIGSDTCTLGQKALEVLLLKLKGNDIKKALVPTRLYGRESLQYDMYDFTIQNFLSSDKATINRMFDDCFYRYKNEFIDRDSINLRNLFYEIMVRIFEAIKRRYISLEDSKELEWMMNKFIDKGAIEYTDASKFIKSLSRLQNTLNCLQKSPSVRIEINKLFAGMRDRTICAISEKKNAENEAYTYSRRMLQDFLIKGMIKTDDTDANIEGLLRNINQLGLKNAAFYLYDKPVKFEKRPKFVFPDYLNLKCVIKSGEIYILPKERQKCSTEDIFTRDELSLKCKGFVTFVVLYKDLIYGFLLSEITRNIYERGEHIAIQLGKSLYLNDIQKRCNTDEKINN